MSNWVPGVRERIVTEYKNHPWVCVMATVDESGKPTARCMICREINNDGRLLFVSDRRTRKDDHLRACPETEICFWLPGQRTQIRLKGQAGVLDAENDNFLRETWWERLPDESRQIFGAAPGDDDPIMPTTFELIVLNPDQVEVQDLTVQANQKNTWKLAGEQWRLAGVM